MVPNWLWLGSLHILLGKKGTVILSSRVSVRPGWDLVCKALRTMPGMELLLSVNDDDSGEGDDSQSVSDNSRHPSIPLPQHCFTWQVEASRRCPSISISPFHPLLSPHPQLLRLLVTFHLDAGTGFPVNVPALIEAERGSGGVYPPSFLPAL